MATGSAAVPARKLRRVNLWFRFLRQPTGRGPEHAAPVASPAPILGPPFLACTTTDIDRLQAEAEHKQVPTEKNSGHFPKNIRVRSLPVETRCPGLYRDEGGNMRIKYFCVVAVLLATSPTAMSQGVSPVKCTISNAGHTINILGSNPTSNAIVCTKAECTANTIAGNTWLCQMEAHQTLPAGASNVPLGTCSGSDRTATTVEVSGLSCN